MINSIEFSNEFEWNFPSEFLSKIDKKSNEKDSNFTS